MRGTEPHCHDCKSRKEIAESDMGEYLVGWECREDHCINGFTEEDDNPVAVALGGWRDAIGVAMELQASARLAEDSCD